MADWTARNEQLRRALDSHPALTLLKAYSREWVIPLFAQIEAAGGLLSSEAFHTILEDARVESTDGEDSISPAERCRRWIEAEWLERPLVDGVYCYRLSTHTAKVLEFVRGLADPRSSVTGARFGSIVNAVRELAVITNPDRSAQVERLDEQLAELQRRRKDMAEGRTRLATVEEMRGQLNEVLDMTSPLPADFAGLGRLVEERHREEARRAFTEAPTKAQMVEVYLYENDLLAARQEGRSFQVFSQMLASPDALQVSDDIEQILSQDFGIQHMAQAERERLATMMSTLLAAQLEVQEAKTRWTASLRRFLTRQPPGRRQQLVAAADRALAAAAQWVETEPATASIPNVLGVGPIDIAESSGLQLWRHNDPQEASVEAVESTGDLPESHRVALRLAAGTGIKAVAATVNRLFAAGATVTGQAVFEATSTEFRRLGVVVSLLSLAATERALDQTSTEELAFDDGRIITIPGIRFHSPISVKKSKDQEVS